MRGRRAIIVGAGIGGLTAAVALRRNGFDVKVLERRADPQLIESGGGMVLWNNAMRALQRLELSDQIRAVGTELELAEWRNPGGRLLATWPVGQVGREVGAPAVALARTELQGTLASAVGEQALRLGTEFTGYTPDDGGVMVHTAGGDDERADVLIGADGIHSTVRTQRTGAEASARYAGYACWFGISDGDAKTTVETFREVDGRGMRFLVFPIGDGRPYWSATVAAPKGTTAEGTGADVAGEKRRLLELYGGWAEPVPALIEATDEATIYRREINDHEPKESWGEGRVTLLGDAAHAITPVLGQGACQAIEDSVVLAECLSAIRDVPAALRAYEARRIPRTKALVKRARLLGTALHWQNPLACRARDQLARIVIPGPALRQHRKDMAYEF